MKNMTVARISKNGKTGHRYPSPMIVDFHDTQISKVNQLKKFSMSKRVLDNQHIVDFANNKTITIELHKDRPFLK